MKLIVYIKGGGPHDGQSFVLEGPEITEDLLETMDSMSIGEDEYLYKISRFDRNRMIAVLTFHHDQTAPGDR